MYTTTDLNSFKKRHTLFLVLFFVSIGLVVATFIVTLCLTNYLNYLYFEIIGGILIAVFTFFCIFFFFRFVDYKRLINHYNSVFIEKKAHADGILLSINKQTITLDDNIRVKELIFEIDGNKSTYYLLTMFDTSKLEINQKYHLLLADNFIEKINYEI